ncbi:cupin domain-containing protein [Pseudomonas chlororaphis]|uniref:cupin domain-containing protein n=1 Tax=Pseudomonas chlororaphis TaxID=587753 RepID=UPI0035D4DA2C
MHPPILNLNDVELEPLPEALSPEGETAGRYQQRFARVGQQLGAQKLGYRLYALPPGMRGSPFHSHRVNEEMFYVVAGEGEVRLGTERFPIRAGDVIACPPGGPEAAHQIINTSAAELRYLAVSTQQQPEICEYPDSNKYAVMDNFNVDADGNASGFVAVARQADGVDYWDGE